MRIVVITSCTGEKAVDHVAEREAEVGDVMMPAEDLYTGQQHVRLMRGVKAFREAHPTNGSGPAL